MPQKFTAFRHFDRFSHFAGLTNLTDSLTDRQAHRPLDICSNRMHIYIAPVVLHLGLGLGLDFGGLQASWVNSLLNILVKI